MSVKICLQLCPRRISCESISASDPPLHQLLVQLAPTSRPYYYDTTVSAFSTKVDDLLHKLEYDVESAIIWFDNNYMKLNKDKCHFLVSGNVTEHLWTKVGDELIWESHEERLLGVTIDKNLNFNSHLTTLCKKVGQKVTALARIARLLPFHKRKIILKTFIESQFSYCPLVWMFCSRKINRKMNYIHERALRLVNDYESSFDRLLKNDKSISIHHRNIHNVAIEMFKVKITYPRHS